MWKTVLFACCLYLVNTVNDVSAQGRVAPGVSPQHYQQQQVPQYQQQQFQQHQVPQQQQQFHQQQVPQHQVHQQQQVPVQHQQQPPVQHHQQQQVHYQQQPITGQQVPQPHGHSHHAGAQPGQLLNAANIVQEKDHIAEHMEVPIDTSKMTDQELQFHYFKMHDADNNNKLDGCELIKSLIHWHEQGSKDHNNPNKVEDKIFKDEELVTLIDPILSMDDSNKDGYIDYPEFVRAQQKAAAANPPK